MRKNPGKSGGLIQFDFAEFGRFYGDLVNAFNMLKVVKLSMNKWVDQRGNGILSPLGASALKAMIKNTIDQAPGGAKNISFEPPHEDWAKIKSSHGYGFDTPWKFTAGVYSNIVATNRSGTHIVGIDRRARVPKVSMSGKRSGNISVELYAAAVEYGNANLPARPLFSKVARAFIQEGVPQLENLLRKSMLTTKKVFESYAGSSTSRGGLGGAVMKTVLGENIDVSQGMNPDKDFGEHQLRAAQIESALSGQGTDKKALARVKAEDRKEVSGFLSKNNIQKENMSAELMAELAKMGYS